MVNLTVPYLSALLSDVSPYRLGDLRFKPDFVEPEQTNTLQYDPSLWPPLPTSPTTDESLWLNSVTPDELEAEANSEIRGQQLLSALPVFLPLEELLGFISVFVRDPTRLVFTLFEDAAFSPMTQERSRFLRRNVTQHYRPHSRYTDLLHAFLPGGHQGRLLAHAAEKTEIQEAFRDGRDVSALNFFHDDIIHRHSVLMDVYRMQLAAHMLKNGKTKNMCDYYRHPTECHHKLGHNCLLSLARRWGGNRWDLSHEHHLNVGHINLPRDPALAVQAIVDLACNPWVKEIHADYIYYSHGSYLRKEGDEQAPLRKLGNKTPNDPKYSTQWHLPNLKLPEAWATTTGSDNVKIMIIDTGIDPTHEDLKDNLWVNTKEQSGNNKDDDGNGFVDDIYGINPDSKDGNVVDDQGHGTHMAGVAAATGNNGKGVSGVMWKAKLVTCKFMGQSGGKLSSVATCLNYAVDNKVQIASMSFGGGQGLPAIETALKSACKGGVFSVMSSGNNHRDNDKTPNYPSQYATDPATCSVATSSYTKTLTRLDEANWGKTTVQIAAPGDYIYATGRSDTYEFRGGTSPASPTVAGTIGLGVAVNPNLSASKIRDMVKSSVSTMASMKDQVQWGGFVDSVKFIQAAKKG